MARKVKFPLHMANGADVRTLEDLKENFDLTSVLEYYSTGNPPEHLTNNQTVQ